MKIFLRVLALGVLWASAGCSLLLDFEQCESNLDCNGSICTDGVCERPPCDSATVCEQFGPNFACVNEACIKITDDRCSVPFDDGIGDEPVYHIGGLFPLSGRNGDKGDATSRGAYVALNQINGTSNGVDGTRLSLLLCDTENSEDTAVEVATYMTETLGLRAMIGSISSGETLDVASEVTIDRDVVLISPASTSPQITGLDDNDLVWRTIASDALQGPALAKLVQSKGFSNFVVMSADSAYGQGLYDAFLNAGVFDSDDFEVVQYQTDDNGAVIAETFINRMTELLGENDPDAIVILGSVESQQIIFSLETAFFEPDEMLNPIWVLSEAGRDLGLFESEFDNTRDRIIGTVFRQNDTPTFQSFKSRFAAEHSLQAENHPFADKAYDAAYLLSLSVAASGKLHEASGSDIAEFLKKTGTGSPFNAGDDFAAAITALQGGGIDFAGASGPVDFDLATGDVDSTVLEWSIVDDDFVDGDAL